MSQGENGFGCVEGVNLVTMPGSTPLLITPLKKDGDQVSLDLESMGGQVVIIFCDGSGLTFNANDEHLLKDETSGRILFKNGIAFSYDYQGKAKELRVLAPDMGQ